jgi:uncharacterized membrane protein
LRIINASLFKYADISNYIIPVIFIAALYLSIRVEIATYWNQLYEGSFNSLSAGNRDFLWFKTIWIINYTLLFLCSAAFIIMFKIKKPFPAYINIVLLLIALLMFHVQGLYAISMVRESFIDPSQFFKSGHYNIYIRYISLAFIALTLFVLYRYVREAYLPIGLKKIFDIMLHVSVIWLTSSELIHWMDLAGYTQLYKLGLSILWGVYALLLIILGIWKKKKGLRLMAIILFGITLIKLFFYDISHLNTLSKTIVMVSLGVLLLIISFLYNKYKHIISDEN